ncbi:MAG: polysaccharide deacetylase [Aquaticitalea sp.]
MKHTGKFVISLDFELMWGVRDIQTTETYGRNILGVWEALPKMIDAFESHQVKATFATVGFLFASNKEELNTYFPDEKPKYANPNLSPYNGHFDLVKENEAHDKYHFASELIALLQKYPNQEIASHTFSHYYCLEKGQTPNDFNNDTVAAILIAKEKGIILRSLIFPRNQFNESYLEILKNNGITSYRGNERVWFYTAATEETIFKKAFRLMDTYVKISGHNSYDLDDIQKNTPYDIPSSRFLRPFSPKLKPLETLRLKRILNSMTFAAKNSKVYHLWWHPHNFGAHQKENFEFLNKILQHYDVLNSQYGFESITMSELSNQLKEQS